MHLRALRLQNFRCFREASFEFPRVTLLTGRNSSGKTTVINGLLTVIQGTQVEPYPFSLTQNGDLCTLGGYRDLVYGKQVRSPLGLDIKIGSGAYQADAEDQWSVEVVYEYFRGTRSGAPRRIKIQSDKGSFIADI